MEDKNQTGGAYADERAQTSSGHASSAATATATAPTTAVAPTSPFISWFNERLKSKSVVLDFRGEDLPVLEVGANNQVKLKSLTGGHEYVALDERIVDDLMQQII